MVRRSVPLLGTLLALLLLFVVAAPVSAYNHENDYHLRLTRLDPLKCGTSIGIRAQLTDRKGHPVSGKTIHFKIIEGRNWATLSPAQAITDSGGRAVTYVQLACTQKKHPVEILATGPGDARARITLVLHKEHGGDEDHHEGDRSAAAAIASTTTGSTGTGGGLIATGASGSVLASPAASTGPSTIGILLLTPALIGLLFGFLALVHRRSTPGTRRPATA